MSLSTPTTLQPSSASVRAQSEPIRPPDPVIKYLLCRGHSFQYNSQFPAALRISIALFVDSERSLVQNIQYARREFRTAPLEHKG